MSLAKDKKVAGRASPAVLPRQQVMAVEDPRADARFLGQLSRFARKSVQIIDELGNQSRHKLNVATHRD
jgi:hypothetical protein